MLEKGFQSQAMLKKTPKEFSQARQGYDKVQSSLLKPQVQAQRACPGSSLS